MTEDDNVQNNMTQALNQTFEAFNMTDDGFKEIELTDLAKNITFWPLLTLDSGGDVRAVDTVPEYARELHLNYTVDGN